VSYTGVLGDGIAYIIKARVQLLRDLGSSIAPASDSVSIKVRRP
jgi:O-acetylhomoserine (thiol)-lyase